MPKPTDKSKSSTHAPSTNEHDSEIIDIDNVTGSSSSESDAGPARARRGGDAIFSIA
jgi:hypothetical protein